MVAIGIASKLWIGYNSIIGRVDHLDNFKTRVSNIIESDPNIIKYKPKLYYETRIKSFDRIVDKINRKRRIPKDIYGLRIIYSSVNPKDEFLGYYIKYSLDNEFKTLYYNKDYIVYPKENNYQSLHFGVWDNHCLFDIQVRNIDMDYWAKKGGASNYYLKK